MRVGGLATGMDIDQIVDRLMQAERIPLDKMNQDRTMLTWKQEAFRELNRSLLELDNMMLDMKLSRTYQTKSVRSSQEQAVTASGNPQTDDGIYQIEVKQLATRAMNVGEKSVDLDTVIDEEFVNEEITFHTFDVNGDQKHHTIKVEEGDTIGNILMKITNANNDVRAFYDVDQKRVILETTRTGKYNPNEEGSEIVFDSAEFFEDVLGLKQDNEKGGQNAIFTYNQNLELESKTNSYTINNLDLQFHGITNGAATLSVTNDTDHTFEKIIEFVNKYNEVIEKLNQSQQEERYRDFPPLTDAQKEEMTEDQIKKWEEKAKSGILRGETVITNAMSQMRSNWYARVDTGGAFSSLTEIGIETSPNYLDGGKLIVDEDRLRQALQENPEDVQRLFVNSSDGNSRGIIHRLEDSVRTTIDKIHEHAGRATSTLDNYTLGKRMKDLDKRITAFQDRLMQIETRYWNQFTQMEKAIQRMNDQSAYLLSQFGGGMY